MIQFSSYHLKNCNFLHSPIISDFNHYSLTHTNGSNIQTLERYNNHIIPPTTNYYESFIPPSSIMSSKFQHDHIFLSIFFIPEKLSSTTSLLLFAGLGHFFLDLLSQVALFSTSLTQDAVDGGVLFFVSDLTSLFGGSLHKWQDGLANVLLHVLQLAHGGVSLSQVGISLSWEDQQFGLVFLQSVSVQLQGLLGLVTTTMIDGDTNGQSLLAWNSGSLQLFQGETTSDSQLKVVSSSWWVDNWTKISVSWSWKGSSGSLLSDGSSGFLTSGLVEPSLDVSLPPLTKVDVWHDIIVFDRHFR